MHIPRRGALLAGAAAMLRPAGAQPAPGLWFDPTQLPSYSGRLERWIATPAGDVDRGLLREGTQFVFQTQEAAAMAAAIAPGGTVCVWGIRARSAPVVLTLAWARGDTEPASFVERPSWFVRFIAGRETLLLAGRILAPLFTPQGEGMGVILTGDAGAIRLPVATHARLADALRPGEMVAAEGLGTRREGLLAIDAARLGHDAASLQPVPAEAPRP